MSKQLTGNRLYIRIPKKTNPINTYTKTQIDDLLNLKVDKVTLTDYMTIAAFLSTIDDYYTKTQVDAKEMSINTRIGNLGSDLASVSSDVGRLDTELTDLGNNIPSVYVKEIDDNNVDRIISYTNQNSTTNTIDYKTIKHEASYSTNNISKYWITEVYNNSTDNGLWYKNNAGVDKRIATRDDLANYQLSTTTGLHTNTNTIVGAINETYDSIQTATANLSFNWNSAVVDTTKNNTITGEWKGNNVIAIRGYCYLLSSLYVGYSTIFQLATDLKRRPFNNPTGSYSALPSWTANGIIKRGTGAYLCSVFIDGNGNLNFSTVNNISTDDTRELEFYFLMETV